MKIIKTKIIRKYVNLNGMQIHIRTAGNPSSEHRPLICFHLSPVSGIIFEEWISEMAKDRIVYAPDTPGFGMSDFPNLPPNIEYYAAIMNQLIRFIGLKEVDVMGYHTGSKICVELARNQEELVKHLILVSAPVYNDAELNKQISEMGSPREPRADGSHLIQIWKAVWKWRGPDQTPNDLMRIFPDHIQGGKRSAWGHQAAFSYSYPEALRNIKNPILVLNTNDDLTIYTKRIRNYLLNGKILALPKWGHGFLDSRTKDTARIVRKFLDHDKWPKEAL